MKKKYTSNDTRNSASRFGQVIGETFENSIIEFVKAYIEQKHPEFELLLPTKRKTITLEMYGGSTKQVDSVVIQSGSADPVALFESKWLKDARHHNDKGAWMLQLREVRKNYSTIRGVAALLAGHWTEGVGVLLMGEGGIRMVLVATDEEVYSTLQPHLDNFLGKDTFTLNAFEMRKSYPRPWDLANLIEEMIQDGSLNKVADTWLNFQRGVDNNGNPITGSDRVKQTIDEFLAPLPNNPAIKKLEISLSIETGNTIFEEFTDMESAIDFIQKHFSTPENILQKITPRKKPTDNS